MIAGLVLAAGSGSRLGQAKAPLLVDGERLVDRAVRILREGGCADVFVVLGAWRGAVPDATIVVNEAWETGMGSSLKSGLQALLHQPEITHAVVTLVDLPDITAASVRAIVTQPGELVVGTYGVRHGHPMKLGRGHWAAISDGLTGDVGARTYLQGRADVVHVPLDAWGADQDIDTPADLEAVGQRSRKSAVRQYDRD